MISTRARRRWLTVGTLLYLATIPLSYLRFESRLYEPVPQSTAVAAPPQQDELRPPPPASETKH